MRDAGWVGIDQEIRNDTVMFYNAPLCLDFCTFEKRRVFKYSDHLRSPDFTTQNKDLRPKCRSRVGASRLLLFAADFRTG